MGACTGRLVGFAPLLSRLRPLARAAISTPRAPLVLHYEIGAAQLTEQRQQASGHFATADAPLVAPRAGSQDAATTIEKQQKSGYFPEADAALH
jgi:hypothetical protein